MPEPTPQKTQPGPDAKGKTTAGPASAASTPVCVPQDHYLDSGLVDYGMWVEMFQNTPPQPSPPEGYRRGRIWA